MTKTISPALAIVFDLKGIGERLELRTILRALRDSRLILLEGIDANFESRSSAVNGPWVPRKDTRPHPLLEETGALRKAATGKGPGHVTIWQSDGFEFGIDPSVLEARLPGMSDAEAAERDPLGGIRAAASHNFGDPRRNLPAREFITPPDPFIDRAFLLVVDFVEANL